MPPMIRSGQNSACPTHRSAIINVLHAMCNEMATDLGKLEAKITQVGDRVERLCTSRKESAIHNRLIDQRFSAQNSAYQPNIQQADQKQKGLSQLQWKIDLPRRRSQLQSAIHNRLIDERFSAQNSAYQPNIQQANHKQKGLGQLQWKVSLPQSHSQPANSENRPLIKAANRWPHDHSNPRQQVIPLNDPIGVINLGGSGNIGRISDLPIAPAVGGQADNHQPPRWHDDDQPNQSTSLPKNLTPKVNRPPVADQPQSWCDYSPPPPTLGGQPTANQPGDWPQNYRPPVVNKRRGINQPVQNIGHLADSENQPSYFLPILEEGPSKGSDGEGMANQPCIFLESEEFRPPRKPPDLGRQRDSLETDRLVSAKFYMADFMLKDWNISIGQCEKELAEADLTKLPRDAYWPMIKLHWPIKEEIQVYWDNVVLQVARSANMTLHNNLIPADHNYAMINLGIWLSDGCQPTFGQAVQESLLANFKGWNNVIGQ